ncbi:hypothetical protein QZH41_017527, partial [Actinostola sp. cb2023]
EVLGNFYCDRLKDHYSIAPYSLLGLQALAVNQELPGQLVVKVAQTIFAEINTQSLMQSGRYTVYGLLLACINNNLNDLQTLGSDFVFGFIQAMDGEKDPRSLLLVFQLVSMLVKYFPIALFVEDLFEVTSCYFPIDFNPVSPSDDAITRDDLVLGLRKCLSSTTLFAPFCLPLLLEKLSSDVIDAKIDSLLTLASCMDVYTMPNIKVYLDPFWKAIQREVYQTISSELEKEDNQQTRDDFIGTIVKECHQHLSSLDLRMMKPNGRILQATSSGAESAYHQVMSSTLPLLLDKYNTQPAGVAKKITLDVILELLKVAKQFHPTIQDSPVTANKDLLMSIMFEALTCNSPAMNCAGITGLVAMVNLSDVCSDAQVSLLIQHLTRHALNSTDITLRQESTTALAFLSCIFPVLIKTELLPVVQSHLNSEESVEMDCDIATTSTDSHTYAMDTLAVVCTEESLVRHIIPVIVHHGNYLIHVDQVTDAIKSKSTKTFKSLLSVVEGTLKHKVVPLEYYSNELVPDVLCLVLEPVLQGTQLNIVFEPDILEVISSVLRVITSQSASADKTLHLVVDLFVDGRLPNSLDMYKDTIFMPLEVTSPWQQTQLIGILTSVLCSARKEVCIPKYNILLSKIQYMACYSSHKRTNISAAKCLAGLINKMNEGEQMNTLLQHLMNTIWPCITDSKYHKQHWSLLITLLWITRALVIRSHPTSTECIKKIISLFDNDDLGKVACDGFYILIVDSEDIMTTSMHADIRIMYRQRLFMETLPLLLSGFQSAFPGYKYTYLTALSHLLQWIPKQVLMSEIPNLMPLLIQSLSHDQPSLLISSLQTLYSLVFDAPEAVTRQVTSLIPNFLRLVKLESSMNVRIESLKCLGAMTTLPHHVVYVYKFKVIKNLGPTLDDNKRLVRSAAVTCRNEW